ncbi:hypothetical protein DOTSEDRAFT_52723 [Dothistroma septosporum NZE10]|uniref:ubiquitinyl hydrolase 1 n=1 Tax=Dothistroma septosporum (strain NZE10 / CBS 128990) TaxID=675120 RepID=N1PPY3_DOTSN|nr:hypothetical protein DOTSEDRAFT_52723 [Dothistroma septosporum NZE10]
MSGGENGATAAGAGDGAAQSLESINLGRSMSARSASPAKRSRADAAMEDAEQKHVSSALQQTEMMPGSFSTDVQGVDDVEMEGMTPASNGLNTQESATNGLTGAGEAIHYSTTSFQSRNEAPPPYKTNDDYSTEQIDEQVSQVEELDNKALDEGDRGVVISSRWLSRVLSRASKNLKNNDFRKSDREGAVGPLDNSDIVPPGAFNDPLLNDREGKPYIALNQGLVIGQDITILPFDAYGEIAAKYGAASGQKAITRYAHNTVTDPDSMSKNVLYELYPPTITVRKVPWRDSNGDKPAKAKVTPISELRKRKEWMTRGQTGPEDAPVLISSRSERVQHFLRRAKEAAEISNGTKVKVWRVLEQARPDTSGSLVVTPPASRSASPVKYRTTKLVVDQSSFEKMEIGKDLEYCDVMEDQTVNDKYNGKATMDLTGLGAVQAATILLEEQTGGPAGGEFSSDSKKGLKTIFNNLNRKNNGSKPSSTTASGATSPTPGMITRGRTRKDGRTRGVVGLTNLGNTCYMNSALQCIRSVEELAVYFLSKEYKKEINNDNPLGHHGAMANAYFTVLAGVYGDNSGSAYTPREFKSKLGSIQPLFSGYGQQDSQEFLSFLVDALHEDLNRIIKKPYIENPDSDDAKVHDPEYIHELGETYRANHQKRNDSVATDLFGGFYKNTMECPNCEKVSVTFDPYSLLTVQLPMDHAFQHTITFIPLHGKPINHEIDIDKNSTIKILKESIAKKHNTDASRLWMAEVYSHKIYKVFADNITLAGANIVANDYIFIFELEHASTNAPSGKKSYTPYGTAKDVDVVPTEGMVSSQADAFAVPIFSRVKNNTGSTANQALHPLYITLTRDEAKDYEVVMKKVLLAVANVTSRPILTEFHGREVRKADSEEVDEDTEIVKDQATPDDTAGVSDHSTQSEDGYVAISLDKADSSAVEVNEPSEDDEIRTAIPDGFMDGQYFLPDALRHQLFDLKWAKSNDGNLHCASMGSFAGDVRPMFDRVKQPECRALTHSPGSNDTDESGEDANHESDDSDDDGGIDDEPDITLGGQDNTTTSSPDADGNDEEALPTSGRAQSQPSWKRKKNKKRRKGGKKGTWKAQGRSGGQHAYGNQNNQSRQHGFRQDGSTTGADLNEDSPYYIQLGEAIILDWQPDAFDSLFMGEANDVQEMRGHVYHSDDGRNGRVFADPDLAARKQRRSERKKHGIDLEDCFVETGKREILSEDNAWYCNRCKEMRRAAKTLQIWTLPDILVVHMKRFGGTRSFRDKIDVLVDYPVEGLDMNDKVGLKEDGKDYVYDLFAVDNHYGGLGGGHYTAMAKNFHDGEWYDYNDSATSKISSSAAKLKSAAAYLLFYRRRSERPLGPQNLRDLVMESRNPPAESTADDLDEAGSGEDKLGGPTHSSRGSSSALAVAEAGVTSRQSHAGNGGAGANNNPTQKTTMTNEEMSEARYGGSTGWDFGSIGVDAANNDGDGDSTKAQLSDADSGMGRSVTSDSEFDRTGAHNSPQDDVRGYEDVMSFEDFVASDNTDRHYGDPTTDIHLDDAHDATQSE